MVGIFCSSHRAQIILKMIVQKIILRLKFYFVKIFFSKGNFGFKALFLRYKKKYIFLCTSG